MPISIDFSAMANTTGWSDSRFTQSNPGLLDIASGYLEVNTQSSNDTLSLTTSPSVTRGLDIFLQGNQIALTTASPKFYLDYTDVNNYLGIYFHRANTDTSYIVLINNNAGVISDTNLNSTPMTDAALNGLALFELNISGAPNGSDYAVSVTLNSTSYSHTVTGYSPAGTVGMLLDRVATTTANNYIRVQKFTISGTATAPANGIPSLPVKSKSGTPLAAGTSVSVTVNTTTGTNVYAKTALTITSANQIPVIDLSSAVSAGTIANGDTVNYRVDYGGETTIVPQTVVASPT